MTRWNMYCQNPIYRLCGPYLLEKIMILILAEISFNTDNELPVISFMCGYPIVKDKEEVT